MAKINNETLITVRNNTGGGIAYKNEMNILRRWDRPNFKRPNSIKKLQFLELQQSIAQRGVYNMFANGMLLIDENNAQEIMELLGIPELDEYVCTLEEITSLLDGVDYEDLENVLKWGTQTQTDSIITVATNREIEDANVIKIIKDVTGVDVTISPVDKTTKKTVERPPRNKKANEEKPARNKKTPKKEEDVKEEDVKEEVKVEKKPATKKK